MTPSSSPSAAGSSTKVAGLSLPTSPHIEFKIGKKHREYKYPIMRLCQLSTSYHPNSASVREEMDGAVKPTNELIEITAVAFEIAFPYEVNIHKALSTELMGFVKWIKSMHLPEERPKTPQHSSRIF